MPRLNALRFVWTLYGRKATYWSKATFGAGDSEQRNGSRFAKVYWTGLTMRVTI